MALIVYFRLESCLLADKISTNQNRGITDLLSFYFIALVYVPLDKIHFYEMMDDHSVSIKIFLLVNIFFSIEVGI